MSAADARPPWAARRAYVEACDVRPDVRPRARGAGAKHTPTRGKVFGPQGPSVRPHEGYGRGVVTPRPVFSLGDGPGVTSSYARMGMNTVAGVGDSCARPINVGTYQGWAARLVGSGRWGAYAHGSPPVHGFETPPGRAKHDEQHCKQRRVKWY